MNNPLGVSPSKGKQGNIHINIHVPSIFVTHIIKPTRIAYHTATLIDNILVISLDFHTISGNIIYGLTDHLPNLLNYKRNYYVA